MSSRTKILQAIRDSLAASAAHDTAYAGTRPHAGEPEGKKSRLPEAQQTGGLAGEWIAGVPPASIAHFGARLEAVGGEWCLVGDVADARQVLFAILRDGGARRVAISDGPLLQAVIATAGEAAPFEVLRSPSPGELFEADAGVTCAQWAIAESGTLVLESGAERHRLLSLVPPLHIALVPVGRLCGTLGDALGLLRSGPSAVGSRAVTFITGPSRTADIEQMLVLGVHGPQRLFVIFVQEYEDANA